MHIALAGPVSLDVLAPGAIDALGTSGYPFPMTAELARAYAEAGHTVSVVTSATDITEPRSWRASSGMSVDVVPMRARARDRALDLFAHEAQWVGSTLDRLGPDVVHAHWSYEFAAGSLQGTAPSLITVHDWAPAVFRQSRDAYRALRWRLQRKVLRQAVDVTAPSTYIAERVTRRFGLSCPVIPNGLRIVPPQSDRREELAVAALNAADGRRKNVGSLLRAWPAVLATHPSAVLRLAGPPFGPSGATATWASARGLTRNVEFVGELKAASVNAWLARHAVMVHPSLEESFGMVLIEAMAAGCVVVAGARSGAVPEVVADAGLLVDVRRPQAIAGAISELLADPDKQARMRDRGRAKAAGYDIGSVAGRYVEELERVMK
jgi:glycosyltransferase involved in cell wall biosynthesis